MKKLMMVVAILFATSMYAQNVNIDSNSVNITTTVVDIPDSSQLTMNKVYEDMKQGIAGLASSLKVGVEYIWTILIRQQTVKSIVYLIIMIIGLILLINWTKKYKSNEEWCNNDFTTGLGVIRVFQVIIGGILFIFSFILSCFIVLVFID